MKAISSTAARAITHDPARPEPDEPIRHVHHLFERQAGLTPHARAISFEGVDWTYAELDRAASRIAVALRRRPLGSEPLVGVCVDRSCQMIACLLGVMKAGAAYLPLDPDLPDARLRQIAEDARPALVLGRSQVLRGGVFAGVPVMAVDPILAADAPEAFLVAGATRSPPEGMAPDGLAYVMYTSGSTGRPKGVEIRHSSIINLLASAMAEPGLGAADVVLSATRMSFDVSVLDFFLPLTCGAHLVLVSQDVAGDPERLAEAIGRSGATVMQATPATWRSLCDAGWPGSARLRIWSGGEALSADLARRLLPLCREIWNLYGPTETTIWSSVHKVAPGDDPVPIGRPMRETSLHIVDEGLSAVVAGAIGELCIGGAGLARGYRFRPDLTDDRFVRLADGTPAYRTGDLARRDAGGALLCLGRIDDQVKIRGHRVEMGEIEAVLSAHPRVAWAAVRCWPDAIGENTLTAYVVPRDGGADLPDLPDYLRGLLPAYMVPRRFVPMASFAMTPNGKIDRNALPDPAALARRTGAEAVMIAGLSASEAKLAAIWRELLDPGAIGRQDDFFDLGGYSLLTVRLIRRIGETFGRTLSMGDLFRASTLSAMAGLIDRPAVGGAAAPSIIPLRPMGHRPPLFWLDAGPLVRRVAQAIGPDQPVFGVTATAGQEAVLAAGGMPIPALATVLADHIARFHPAGPYYIGGWCRWGIVAFEVAHQLRQRGCEVALLVLLDAENPAGVGLRGPVRRWRKRLGSALRKALPRRGAVEAASFSQMVEDAAGRYRPPCYDGDVALFQPIDASIDTRIEGGWRSTVTGRLTVRRTAGDHESMVRAENAALLGNAIGEALVRAQTRCP